MLTPLAEAVARERVRANCLLLLFSLAVMDSPFHDTAAEEVLGELNQELVPELPCSLAQGVDADSAYALAQLPHVSDFCLEGAAPDTWIITSVGSMLGLWI